MFEEPLSVADVARLAEALLPKELWDYVDGGSGAETTLAANRSGYLQLSNGGAGAHLFVPDKFVPIDTQSASTATTNTMTVGACAANPAPNSTCTPLTSPAINICTSSAPTGGFHVVVFYASTLSVIENGSFATNTGCGADGTEGDVQGISAMAALLTAYAAADGTDDHVVAIQSIGAPRPPKRPNPPAAARQKKRPAPFCAERLLL